jgi:hypothetical protein
MIEASDSPPAAPSATDAERQAQVELVQAELGEPAHLRSKLGWIIKRVGWDACRELLDETAAIEDAGGLFIACDFRARERRSKGGVFFTLFRLRFPQFAWRRPKWQRKMKRKKKASRAKGSAPAWADRLEMARESAEKRGTIVSSPKTTLMGRPLGIAERGACVAFSLHFADAPSLPKGLPVPPAGAAGTSYTVFVVLKQWRKVAELLALDPSDQLVVEGYSFYDPEVEGLVLLAQSVKTREQQRAQFAKAADAAPAASATPPATSAPASPSAPEVVGRRKAR